ncbi:MAG: Succinyl-CoA ligase [ADP-forming] subunit beta [Alphaproteobacteria bacterium MarineAlpha6_Bin3]|nr:MAG: Succinyl-CoA ligase [ADP-forming] subunit beta [Alphaproteobacteria bacterium MarineAlpha6_Bin3]
MNIHEYQAKELLKKNGVNVPNGKVAFTVEEALQVAKELDSGVWVVKAQIHAGGRGKAGGVKVVKSLEEVESASKEIMGKTLVTPQTGAQGKVVKKLYVEEGSNIEKEFYISMVIDRETNGITVVASTEGGMEIEEVAKKTPEKIVKHKLKPCAEMQVNEAEEIASKLGLEGDLVKKVADFILSIHKTTVSLEALMVEINPMVITKEKEVYALDAKMGFDENSFYRHEDIANLRDEDEEDPLELEAKKHDLNYVKLDGEIGVMVNGAGLAMATMDLIKQNGGKPANFMDIAGAATPERVAAAFKLLYSDKDVKGILCNVFGGMMRTNSIAEGLVTAANEVKMAKPVVVRLEGTNIELARKILKESGLPFISASTFGETAKKIVEAVKNKEK